MKVSIQDEVWYLEYIVTSRDSVELPKDKDDELLQAWFRIYDAIQDAYNLIASR